MKRNILYFIMLVCTLGVFSSCSKDDDNNVSFPIDTELTGTYKGTLDIFIEDVKGGSVAKNVKITKASDSSVDLEIIDFTFLTMNLGTIVLKNCVLAKKDGVYSFTCKQPLKVDKYSLMADIDAEGSFSNGTMALKLDIDAKLGNIKQDVDVYYKGTKLKGGESNEAKITAFTIESSVITVAPIINEEKGTIMFHVSDEATDNQLKLAPVISISPKATILPASGVSQDFSNGNTVIYTVTAEDGTSKNYVASIAGTAKVLTYDFENWTEQKSGDRLLGFYSPTGGQWDSSNMGVYFIKGTMGGDYPDLDTCPYSVEKVSDAHLGNGAAKIVTIDSKGDGLVPKITAGTLFMGSFNLNYVFEIALKSTRFGLVWDKKPLQVTGYYKYTPGPDYYFCSSQDAIDKAEIDKTKKDAFSISAVLYEIESEDDANCLDGTNIYTATDRIVAMAQFSSDSKVDKYTPFTLDLQYIKAHDPKNKQYRFAVIASSSKDGNLFSGAPGSTLYLDDIKIASE